MARQLASQGWAVAVNYRSGSDAAEQVVADIRASGGQAAAYQADVTEEKEVRRLIDRAGADLGPVLAVVANATGPQPPIAVEELTWQAYLDQLTFFVLSPTLLVQAALPAMKEHRHGRVIMIGSDMVDRAKPLWSAYSAAKAAQAGLTKVWARELGPYGITVNLVAPGFIPVERHEGADTEVVPTPRCRSAGWARPTTSPEWSAIWPRIRPDSSPGNGSRSTAPIPSASRLRRKR